MSWLPSARDLDRRIVFRRRAAGTDAMGQANGAWADLAGGSVWARVQFVSDGERMRAGQVEGYAEVRFVVRWSETVAAVTPADRISWGGEVYEIVGIPKEMGRREFLEFSAVRSEAEG